MSSSSDAPSRSPNPNKTFRWRYWRLVFFFGRSLLSLWIFDYFLPRVLGFRWARALSGARHRRLARKFRSLATRMGGVMIKLGQFLSSRVDLLPPGVIEELSGLQDEVEPVGIQAVRNQIESSLGHPPERVFSDFEAEPVASASLGQVHLAGRVLTEAGEAGPDKTAVKVQRPNIETIIEVDLAALQWAVGWLKNIGFIRRRADLDALYEEFSANLREELDYESEARNAERFADLAENNPGIQIPRPHWDVSTDRVLVLDRIEGIKITRYDELDRAGVSRHEVARRLLLFYLQQIYEDGFFHADPHPGNIFVQPDESAPEVEEGVPFRLVFVDFGMVGRVPTEQRQKLRDLLIAAIQRRYRRMVRLAKELDFLLPEADEDEVARALETLFDRYYGLSLGELADVDLDEIEGLIDEFRDILYEFPFQVPQNFILLGRCLGILNGLTTGLDPEFRPVVEIEAFAEDIAGDELGPEFEELSREALQWIGAVTRLPHQLDRTLRDLHRNPLSVTLDAGDEELAPRLDRIAGAVNRLSDTLIILATAGGGYALHQEFAYLAYSLWGVGTLVLLRSWWYRM